VLFGVFALYGLSGYGDAVLRFVRGRKKAAKVTPPLPGDEK
jgi:hypothetical protein